jgi:hypothetical protein
MRTPRWLRLLKEFLLMTSLTICLLLVLEMGVRAFKGYQETSRKVEKETLPFRVAYDTPAWTDEYLREFRESNRVDWRSYVYWRRVPYTGKYINIDSTGIRRTINYPANSDSIVRVFVFGGSAVWGPWVRDECTIPSALSRMLHENGWTNVLITNLGESGYVSTQELVQLMLELRRGNVPDAVVFYDGVNDVSSSFQNKIAGLPLNEDNRRREFNSLARGDPLEFLGYSSRLFRELLQLRERILPKLHALSSRGPEGTKEDVSESSDALAQSTLDTYLANMRLVETLGKEYGFACFFFWQPTVFSKDAVSPHEDQVRGSFNRDASALYDLVYSKMHLSSGTIAGLYDLQKVFGSRSETIFVDYCHTSENGNAMVANVIGGVLFDQRQRVREAAGEHRHQLVDTIEGEHERL